MQVLQQRGIFWAGREKVLPAYNTAIIVYELHTNMKKLTLNSDINSCRRLRSSNIRSIAGVRVCVISVDRCKCQQFWLRNHLPCIWRPLVAGARWWLGRAANVQAGSLIFSNGIGCVQLRSINIWKERFTWKLHNTEANKIKEFLKRTTRVFILTKVAVWKDHLRQKCCLSN